LSILFTPSPGCLYFVEAWAGKRFVDNSEIDRTGKYVGLLEIPSNNKDLRFESDVSTNIKKIGFEGGGSPASKSPSLCVSIRSNQIYTGESVGKPFQDFWSDICLLVTSLVFSN